MVNPKVTARRLLAPLLRLLEKSEPELEQVIQHLESDPLFAELVSAGVVGKQETRRVPKESLREEGTLRLGFSEDTHYGLPYRIDEERLRALLKGKSEEQAKLRCRQAHRQRAP